MKYKLLLFITIIFSLSTLLGQTSTPDDWVKILEEDYSTNILLHPATGQARFLQFSITHPLPLNGTDPLAKAWDFLRQFGGLWGIADPTLTFIYEGTQIDLAGNEHLRFRQQHQGVAVFDGELRFHFDRSAHLRTISGVVLPCQDVPVQAQISPTKAIETAKLILQKENKGNYHSLASPRLVVFYSGLVQGLSGQSHLAYELLLGDGIADRQYVYLDAINGRLLESLPANCSILDREIYDGNTSGSPVWEEGDVYPGSLSTAEQTLVQVAEQTYYFFFHAFGFDSFDNNGSTMKSVADANNVSCPNATWNGTSTNFCTGFAHDDIVGHEWGHAYTEYTNNLIYAWQAGAINEAYSDIWGETIDLLNNYAIDSGEGNLRTACNSSPRWELGEGRGNALRDMWMPSCDGDPDAVTAANYWCSTGDSGGVHINSGIPNHAYALLVDGGTFNSETVTGLGFTKAAHIFWQAQSQYLSRTSDFAALAVALRAACADLVGVDLPALGFTATDPGLSGEMITLTDCDEVDHAISAVAMDATPSCMFQPLLDANTPDICDLNDLQIIYSIDFESGSTGWTATEVPTNPSTWTSRNWIMDSSLPDSRSGQAMYGPDPVYGDCSSDLENGIIELASPTIDVPASFTAPLYLSFDHYVSMELNWDGGIVQYQIDGGSWTDVGSSDFTFNPYNVNLRTAGQGNDNPLAGKASFTGADGGSVAGTWGTSHINMGNQAGKTVRFRWQLGVDGCNGWDGWYIDNVLVGGCESAILPVRWESFTVKAADQLALLEWTTRQEENNAGFWVERSTDPKAAFRTLTWVAGTGTTSSLQNYEYQDGDIYPGTTYYYRLRQVDFDGTESVSPLRELRFMGNSTASFVVFPNPARSMAQLRWLGEFADELQVSVYHIDGRQAKDPAIYQQVNTSQQLSLDLSGLMAGVYWVVVTGADGLALRSRVVVG